MQPFTRLFSLLFLLIAIAGCGQKGPLILPEEGSPKKAEQPSG